MTPQYSRDFNTWIDIGPAAGYKVSPSGTNRSHMHIIENPLPFDFGSVAAGANTIDDTLYGRMKVIPTANSTGDVVTIMMALLYPGPLNASQGKPRGSVFSLPGMDY